MKNLLYQFYNEGFATTFIKKPINFISKKIKNKSIKTIISYIIYILYTIIVLSLVSFYTYKKIKSNF